MKFHFCLAAAPLKRNYRQLVRSNRSSEVNGNLAENARFLIRKKICQILIRRPVDNQAVGTFFAIMRGEKQNGAPKIRVAQVWMRNEKLPGQIWNIAAKSPHEKNLESDHLLFKKRVSICPEVLSNVLLAIQTLN